MGYIDFAVAVAFFLFFFAVVLMFSTNYFSNLSALVKTSEFRSVSEDLFTVFFESKGVPENWHENYSITPVKLGLMEDLYMVPILVRETKASGRTDEPVTVRITFDENCQNKSWNTTVRLYDEDDDEVNIEISNTTFCTGQYLNVSNITWEVNISANQIKKYYLYYSPDENVTDPGYTSLAYNTSSWIPSDRDEWTEATADWTRYEGSTGTVTNDTVNKVRGTRSVNITGNFSATALGLRYNPTANITGVSNGWYIDAWVYVDNKANLKTINITINDNNESISVNISDSISNGNWYHFVKELSSTAGWSNWTAFNASNGIDYIVFFTENNTPDLTRTLKIDGLHFKKKPLTVKNFPEEHINTISYSKFNALKNISYSQLKKTVGEEYKFRVEIAGDSYGGNINQSANVACHESSKILQNSNGTVSKVIAKTCVWK